MTRRKVMALIVFLCFCSSVTSEGVPVSRGQEAGPHDPACYGKVGPCVPAQG